MADVLSTLQAEIDKRFAEIETLQQTMRMLGVAVQVDDVAEDPPKALPAPKQVRKKKHAVDVNDSSTLEPDFAINGVDIYLTVEERKIYDRLDAAPDGEAVPMEDLMQAVGATHKPTIYQLLKELRGKLEPARATVKNVFGAGYVLAVMD